MQVLSMDMIWSEIPRDLANFLRSHLDTVEVVANLTAFPVGWAIHIENQQIMLACEMGYLILDISLGDLSIPLIDGQDSLLLHFAELHGLACVNFTCRQTTRLQLIGNGLRHAWSQCQSTRSRPSGRSILMDAQSYRSKIFFRIYAAPMTGGGFLSCAISTRSEHIRRAGWARIRKAFRIT